MTEAMTQALKREKEPLASRLKQIVTTLAADAKPGDKVMTKDEIDEMWGH
jgi:hypothetical protein